MWKRKKEPPKEPLGNDEESNRDDFFAGPGKKIVRVEIGLTEPPIITFELWTHKKEKSVSGSYFVHMCGTISSAEKTILQGKRCEISLNRHGGFLGSNACKKGQIGRAGLRMGFLDVNLDTNAEYARDLVGLINLHGLERSLDIWITLDLVYPRSLALDDVDSFEVVRMFTGFRNGKA